MNNCARSEEERGTATGEIERANTGAVVNRTISHDDRLFRRKEGAALDTQTEQFVHEALNTIASLVRSHGNYPSNETAIVHVEAVIAMHIPPTGPGLVLKRAITQRPSQEEKDDPDDLNHPYRWGRL